MNWYIKSPWEDFNPYCQSYCIPYNNISLALCWITNKQYRPSFHTLPFRVINLSGINNPFTLTWGTMITCQNKFTDRKRAKKINWSYPKNIYLLIKTDACHKEISAFDPPFVQWNSPKTTLWLLHISVKGHGLLGGKQNTEQSHVYCSNYSLFPYDK